MQSSKRLVLLNFNSINKNCIRNVTATKTATLDVNEGEVKSWKDIPGPPSLPIIGQLHHFLPGQLMSNFMKMQENMYKYYGPIVRMDPIMGRPLMVFLFDPESCAQILRGENWSPLRPGFESFTYYRKYHNKTEEESKRTTGLLSEDGENWRNFRTTVNPVMLKPQTIQLYASQLEDVAEDMIARLRRLRDENNKITTSFDTEMNLWALESIGIVALGGRIKCFSEDLAPDAPQRKLIQCVHDVFVIANELDLKPSLWKLFATPTFKKAMKLYKEIEDLTEYFVRRARKNLESNKPKSDEEKGVLEKLLEIDERTAIIMACDMLFAGVDTAATTMTATLYLLAMNQGIQDKLRKSLTEGDKKYLRACIKESLRVMPVISGNMRKTTKDYNILGYKIPKDSHVVFPHQQMSVLEDQYAKPKEYIPERWIEDGPLSKKNAHPFAYSPFGFGVRMCIGRRIAELEIETFLAQVINNFKVEWNGAPPAVVPTSLNYIKGPFNFTFKDI